MARLSRLVGCFTALALSGCPPGPTDTAVVTVDGIDQIERDPRLCGTVCARWHNMNCEEGQPVCDQYHEPDMVCASWLTCEQWCERTEETGPQPLNLKCLAEASASSCVQLEDVCAF